MGRINLTAEQRGGEAVIRVRDNGLGITTGAYAVAALRPVRFFQPERRFHAQLPPCPE